MLRSVVKGRIRTVMAAFEIERTEDHVVLHVPSGAAGFTRDGPRGGPRGRLLLPDSAEHGFTSRPWTGQDMVMVHRFDEMWSTWRWLTSDRAWVGGSYINLERIWLIGEGVYETEDLTLDLVVGDDGSLTFKDEDELDWSEAVGIYTAAEAGDIRAVGRRAYEHFSSHGWPLRSNWDSWRPEPTRCLLELPGGWEEASPLANASKHEAVAPPSP